MPQARAALRRHLGYPDFRPAQAGVVRSVLKGRDTLAVLPTGVWYAPEEPGVPGSLELRGNPNVLTLDKGSSRLAQAPVAHSWLVEVERVAGEAPPAPAYGPPPLVAA